MPEPAIRLLQQAGDATSIADAVETHAARMLAQGRWQALISWCNAAGEDQDRPWVTYWHGLAMAATDAHAARRILAIAHARFLATGDREGQTLTCSAIMDSFFQHWDMVDDLDLWIERMEGLLNEQWEMPQQARARALSSMVISLRTGSPAIPHCPAYAEEAYSRIPTITDANQKYTMASSLIYYYDLRGAMNRGNELIAMTEPFIAQSDVLPVNEMTWLYRCGLHYLYIGNVEAAAKPCYRGLELARTHGTGWVGYVSAFMAEITQGRLAAAAQLLSESRRVLNPDNRMHLIAVYWLELWLLVVEGRMTQAFSLWEDFSRVPLLGAPFTPFSIMPSYSCWHTRGNTPMHCAASKAISACSRTCTVRHRVQSALYGNLRKVEIGRCRHRGRPTCRHDADWPGQRSYGCAVLDTGDDGLSLRSCARKRHRGELCSNADSQTQSPAPSPDIAAWPRPLKIITLGRFEILRDELPIEFSRKAPKKLVALLKAIIAHGEGGISAEEIIDALWPDLEADAAHEAFATNLHRLRKLLGRPEAIRLIEGRLSIGSAVCWVDVWGFEHLFNVCKSAWKELDAPRALEYADRAMESYRGGFLPNDIDQPWSVSMRERLRSRFIKLVSDTGAHHERTETWAGQWNGTGEASKPTILPRSSIRA